MSDELMDDELLRQEKEAKELNEQTNRQPDTPFSPTETVVGEKGGAVRHPSENPDEDLSSQIERVDLPGGGFGDPNPDIDSTEDDGR